MNSVLIGYDLDKPDQNYANLIGAIKDLGTWWHCLDSTWIIKTSKTCTEVCNILEKHIGASDKILVVKLMRDATWKGFDAGCSDWLQKNL